jgi:hypothetical protein
LKEQGAEVSGCGCPTETCECDSPLHGYFLGALSPSAATEEVFPQAQVKSGAGHNQSIRDQILASATAGQVIDTTGSPAYTPGRGACVNSTGASPVQLAQVGSGLALTGLQIGLTTSGIITSAALAPFTMGISALIGLFPFIFGHHAAAVKKEDSTLCAATPAANNYLQVIDQAVQGGHATPQQAIDALNSLLSDFASAVSSIRHGTDPMSSGECNAACVIYTELHAVVLVRQSEYQDMINAAAAPPPPAPATAVPAPTSPAVMASRPNVVAAPGTPSTSSYASFYGQPAAPAAAAPSSSEWLPIAAVAIGAFFLMRSL